MRKISFYFLSLILLIGAGCQRKAADQQVELPAGMHAATILEVKQASSYSYFQVFEENRKFWMATTILDAKEGDIIYYTDAFEMKDFKSKELNKTFESIMFVNDASLTFEKPQAKSPGAVNPNQVNDLEFAKAPGGMNMEEIYKNKENLDGKVVSIRGMIVKYNRNIMKKNWAHIQDGTSFDGHYDLTITTNDTLAEGNIVVFTGTIHLNKDFGHGYAYDIIMEDAKASEVEDPSAGI